MIARLQEKIQRNTYACESTGLDIDYVCILEAEQMHKDDLFISLCVDSQSRRPQTPITLKKERVRTHYSQKKRYLLQYYKTQLLKG